MTQWQKTQSNHQNFSLAKHYKFVMIGDSSKEVRAAVGCRGYNEVDEVDRPQLGGAGCGHYFARPAKTLRLPDTNRRPTLRSDRAFEINGPRKKFQQLFFAT